MSATRSRSLGRRPMDTQARERLRAAQQAETTAVAVVFSAQAALEEAVARRERTVAAATVAVTTAEAELGAARAALVEVSGLERAAVLLGTSKAELRKAVAAVPAEPVAAESVSPPTVPSGVGSPVPQ